MSKRRINPATGQVELTYPEEKLGERILHVRPEFALYLRHEPNFRRGSNLDACTGGRSLAARGSGPPQSSPSEPWEYWEPTHPCVPFRIPPDLHMIQERIDQRPSPASQDSRLQTRLQPATFNLQPRPQPATCDLQPFSRWGSTLKNLKTINATQCLNRSAPAPTLTQPGSTLPPEIRAASP
jgi:hypothetical protein